MSTEVRLPGLGESIFEGTIVHWLKKPGDVVTRDEGLALVSTDKIETEVPSPVSGVLIEHSVPEGAVVEVGALICVLDALGPSAELEATEADTPAPILLTDVAEPAVDRSAVTEPRLQVTPDGRKLFISPVVRRLARESNVNLSAVVGTGSGGRVTRGDIEAYVGTGYERPLQGYVPGQRIPPGGFGVRLPFATETPGKFAPEVFEGDDVLPLSPLGQAMAEHMAWTWWRAPHVSTVVEVDMSRLIAQRAGRSLTLLVAHVLAQTLPDHKSFNASLTDDGRRILHKRVNLGVAVARKSGGLVVPVLHDAAGMTVEQLGSAWKDKVARARSGKLITDDVRGGTFSLTNVGSNGNLASMPLINQPQVAIVAIGAVVKRVVVVTDGSGADAMAIRPMMYVTLTYDHRANDGAASGRFLRDLRERLERGLPG